MLIKFCGRILRILAPSTHVIVVLRSADVKQSENT